MAPMNNKRRKLGNGKAQIAELTFDPTARQEYLTGFHKRKEQRRKHAQEVASKLDKEEKVKQRKLLRDQRKVNLELHVKEFNREFKKQNPDLSSESENDDDEDGHGRDNNDEWQGFDQVVDNSVEREDEYVDEDKYTTVTVEAMVDSEDEPAAEVRNANESGEKGTAKPEVGDGKDKRIWPKQRGNDGKAKVKKKKFRYETKSERQATRKKESTNSRAAKARRKSKD